VQGIAFMDMYLIRASHRRVSDRLVSHRYAPYRRESYRRAFDGHASDRHVSYGRVSYGRASRVCLIGIRLRVIYFIGIHLMGGSPLRYPPRARGHPNSHPNSLARDKLVFTTASPKNFDYVKRLGAALVFDYNSKTVVGDLIHEFEGKTTAGALSIGPGAADACMDILDKCKGDKFISMATYPVPQPPPKRFVLLTTIYCLYHGVSPIGSNPKPEVYVTSSSLTPPSLTMESVKPFM
jgi:hypothetical protein